MSAVRYLVEGADTLLCISTNVLKWTGAMGAIGLPGCKLCGQPTGLEYASRVLERTLRLCPRCWDPDGSRKRLEPTPPAGSRQGQVVIVLGTDDGLVGTYARYRERLGIVHRPGARYSARLQQLGVPVGQCPLCCSAGPLHEIVQDPGHGEVHVHREPLGSHQLGNTHRG